jgi:hypothetical protein
VSPPLTSIPPKPAAGGRSWLVLGLLALAIISAVLVWKLALQPSKEPSPAAVVPKPAVARPPTPSFEPPPPPPEEEPAPVALPAPARATKPGPAAPAAPRRPTGCEADCTGTATAELQSVLRGKAGQARSCYERALTNNSSLAGSVVINVRVGPAGEACSATVGKDTLGDSVVASCVLQRFRTGPFPKPSGGCVDAEVPIHFVPRQ